MNAKLDWLDIQDTALDEKRIIALTDVGAVLILACNVFYRQRYYWQNDGEDVTDSQWDDIGHAIGLMEHEIMSGLIGAILPHAMASLTGLNMLPCEGSTYNREDWPLLYAALDDEFIIDADTFRVPDLRDKFPLGAGDNYPLGTEGGAELVTLTIAEMPEHLHDIAPHTHSELGAVSTIINGGLEAPANAAQVFPTQTGPEALETEIVGGGEPHDNMPPFLAVRWAIVAG